MGTFFEEAVRELWELLTDHSESQPAWVLNMLGKLNTINRKVDIIMAVQSDLAGVLSDLNASLAQLADDKDAWEALVNQLHDQVDELQAQLDAQKENVVDPATVASLKDTAGKLKDAVANLTVPDPVQTPSGDGSAPAGGTADPTAPAEGTPSPSGPTPVDLSGGPVIAPPADVQVPPDATIPTADGGVTTPLEQGTVDESGMPTGVIPATATGPGDPTAGTAAEGGDVPAEDASATPVGAPADIPTTVAEDAPADAAPADVPATDAPAGATEPAAPSDAVAAGTLDPETKVVEVGADGKVADGTEPTTAGVLPADAQVVPVSE